MRDEYRLSAEALSWHCDPAQFAFETTEELPDFPDILGQTRAVDAVQFGVDVRRDGFNLFVLGPPGVGKKTVVEQCLRRAAASQPVPCDWCYVNNFDDWRRPIAIAVPAGRGTQLKTDMADLVNDLATSVRAALESEEHKNRIRELEQAEEERQRAGFQEIADKARRENIQLIRTPAGFVLAPLREGEVLSPDEFEKLPEDEKDKVHRTVAALQAELQSLIEQMPVLHKEIRDKLRALNRETVNLAIGHLLQSVKSRYADLPAVSAHLDAVENDIVKRADEFQPSDDGQPALPGLFPQPQQPSFLEYNINLLVDNSELQGAPVIHEDHPTYHNLLGRVEHEQHMGALITDFSLIKGGALHRANGGYLIIDAQRLLMQPYAWDALKRALFAQSLKMESLGEMLSLLTTVTLEPQPIPLDLKVVLLGDRYTYYLLHALDADFRELFKVAADFDDRFDRSPENCDLYARFLATRARRDELRPLSRAAVARMLEWAARLAEDAEKLSLQFRVICDTLREADYWASRGGSEIIDAPHVDEAIQKQRYRASRVKESVQEEILRDTVFIATSGKAVGQLNGLTVFDMGDSRFGSPVRITATVRAGRGEIIDIEREVKLGGAIHSKGVLILASFLASRFAVNRPLALSASLAFEQSYGPVEGDSASVGELAALVSALAEVPLHQSLAITGSVNQHGQVQPIGGVNEKIEGFFDICQARGLTGEQGVIIPRANVKHLMLRRDVAAASAQGKFHVYAVSTVDEALELLTGLPAGQPDENGHYPEGSVYGAVQRRIDEFAERRRQLAAELKVPAGEENDHD